MNERVKLPPPEGGLLPAEERLQNVLNALEIRLVKEIRLRDAYREEAGKPDDDFTDGYVSGYVAGLDIAWSLAQTEILRRGACASKFTRGGLFPGLNKCELEHGHADLHYSTITGGFYWSDTDAD